MGRMPAFFAKPRMYLTCLAEARPRTDLSNCRSTSLRARTSLATPRAAKTSEIACFVKKLNSLSLSQRRRPRWPLCASAVARQAQAALAAVAQAPARRPGGPGAGRPGR
eukprot:15453859-Alexandrium_andersonii.AAC.1